MGVERSQKTENKNLHGVVDDILVEVDGDDLVSILSGELHDAVAHGTHADHTNFFDLFADAGRGGEAACSSFSDTFGKHDGWFELFQLTGTCSQIKVGDASGAPPRPLHFQKQIIHVRYDTQNILVFIGGT